MISNTIPVSASSGGIDSDGNVVFGGGTDRVVDTPIVSSDFCAVKLHATTGAEQ